MNRETIDIEALLIRAYRDKAVDKFGQSNDRARRAWGLILLSGPAGCGGGLNVGDRVQSSSFAEWQAATQSRGWAMLEACRGGGLLDLHDAVLGLPTFYVEQLGGMDFQVWDAETAARMGHRITVAEDGATIERMRPRGGRPGPAPASPVLCASIAVWEAHAERVRAKAAADARRARELRPAGPKRPLKAIEATTLLICHARTANRPFVPDVVVTGRRPLYVGGNKRAAGYEPILETPLAEVVERRAVYATWRACLGMLQAACADRADLNVTGPLAPPAPWDEAPAAELGAAPKRRSGARKTGKNDAFAMA